MFYLTLQNKKFTSKLDVHKNNLKAYLNTLLVVYSNEVYKQ